MAFATPADLSTFVGYDVDEARATLFLDLASASIADAAGVPIVDTADDEAVLYGNGSVVLLLPAYPVTAVGQVLVDDVAVTDFTWSRAGELRRAGGWTRGATIAVTYSHGYVAAAVPATVRSVCLEVAARGLMNPQRLQSYTGDGTAAVFGVGSALHTLDLTDDERDRVRRALT